MKIPFNPFIDRSFRGNYFCLIPNSNLAFVVISKIGNTFLKKVAFYSKTGKWIQSSHDTHALIGFNESSEFLIPIDKISDYVQEQGKLIKFAVWRDPVERLISVYKYFCLAKTYRPYFHAVGLYDDTSFEWFMRFVEFELSKKDPQHQDPHIRRQSDHYEINDLDYIVHIDELFTFLKTKHIEFKHEYSNKTCVEFDFDFELYECQIKDLYYDDYQLSVNWRSTVQKSK